MDTSGRLGLAFPNHTSIMESPVFSRGFPPAPDLPAFPTMDMNSSFSQQKPPNGGGFQRQVRISQPKRSSRPNVSMKAYDKNTDSDIFSLGSAFKEGNLDIDDIFKSFGMAKGLEVGAAGGAGPGNVQTVTRTISGDDGRTTKVTTITKVSSPRLVTGDPDFPAFNMLAKRDGSSQTNLLDQVGHQPPRRINLREDRISQYEGVNDDAEIAQPLLPDDREHIREPTAQDGSYEGDTIEFSAPAEPSGFKHEASETSEEFSSNDEMHTTRMLWRKRKMRRKHFGPKHNTGHKEKGSTGMTASEVSVPGEETKLPAVQMMVMHFNRMLDTDRDQFIETLFRAVKINGVEVVKILCQLAVRRGLKLSSAEMREPESSATVLHVALLCNHEELAEYLIDLNDKELVMSVYTKPEYRCQTALHVAVANGNQRLVNKLLKGLPKRDKRALINTVADGSYFTKCHPDGQLCLSAACWAGYGDILVLLAKNGANFALAGVDGNTLLHRLVIASVKYPDMMDYPRMSDKVFEAIGAWATRCRYKTTFRDQIKLEQKQKQINTLQKLLNVQNNQGETPLVLAAQLGSNLLLYLMNMETIYKIPQTKLGSISWVTYDVTDITTLALGSYNKFSVLHVLAHNNGKLSKQGEVEEETDVSLLDTEPIKTLIEMKWSVYRRVYLAWMVLHLVAMSLFTYFTLDEYSADLIFMGFHTDGFVTTSPDRTNLPIKHHLVLCLLLPVAYIILELIDLFGIFPYSIAYMKHIPLHMKLVSRLRSEWVITGNGPYRFVCFTYGVFTIVWFVLYELRLPGQDIFLSMSLLLGWIFILFFTRGCRVTSRFSIMIQKMFFRDLMYFLAVYIVILIAFALSVSAMFSFTHHSEADVPSIMYEMLNIITDLDQRSPRSFQKSDGHTFFTSTLLVVYAIIAVILLMNMLIAMMNTSYETVRITKCNICKQQQLSIMLMMERRLVWLRWVGRRSERNIWHKDWDDVTTRAYLDVTTRSHHSH